MVVDATKNCCHNVYLSITSIPEAIQLKIDESTSTDFKIYGLVVLGAALQAAAIFGTAGIIFAATISGPMVLLGLIPALAIEALGLYMTVQPEGVEDVVCPPPHVNGQPVGLANRGNNCWANAAVQLLCNSHRLINSPGVQATLQMRQLTQAYTTAQHNQNRVVQNVDGQVVRDLMRAAGRRISERNQEDSAEFLTYIFENHPLYQVDEVHRGDPEHHQQPLSMITLPLGEPANPGEEAPDPDFVELLWDRFNYQAGATEVELKFPVAPDDLLIQLGRSGFRQDPATNQGVPFKNSDPIRVPPDLELPPDFFVDNQGVRYTCSGFIVHRGHAMNSGHYVTYLKRPDNTWWLCDDRRVRQVTELYAHRQMLQAYICHFSKVPPNNP